MNIKQLALWVVVLGATIGGVWALDGHVEAQVRRQLNPLVEDVAEIKADVKEIRRLLR